MSIVIAAILTLTAFPSAYAQDPSVHVVIDNELVLFPDALPFVDGNGIVLVPVYCVCGKLGATAEWNKSSNSVIIKNLADTVAINMPTASNKRASVTLNGQTVYTDIAPFT
jgi:hypothetical protein